MLRMRKADHDKRWVVEEIELGDVTRPLQSPSPPSPSVDASVDGASVKAQAGPHPPRHASFRVDGRVALTTTLKVGAGITLAFFLVGGPILCCLLTLALFYLLVAYSTSSERQQETIDLADMEQDIRGRGPRGGVFGVFRFVSRQCARLYQRLVSLKQSVVNYSLTVSIADSQAMLDLDEIMHGSQGGGRRRRRSSLLPCVESECRGNMDVDSAAVMENLVVAEQEAKHKELELGLGYAQLHLTRRTSKPFELRPVHLESLRAARSQSLPLPVMQPLSEEPKEPKELSQNIRIKRLDTEPETESEDESEETETEFEPEFEPEVESESESETDAEFELEPMLPPVPVPVPVPVAVSESEDEEEEEEELVPSPKSASLPASASSSTMAMASTAATKAMHSAVKMLTKTLPAKLQIPVLLSRPLPRLVVHRAPSKLTVSQQMRRMLDEADKMETELDEILARNAAFFQAFEDARESLELPDRTPDDDELSHNALSSGEEEGEFWYEDTLGNEFLDDLPPYLRDAESESKTETVTETAEIIKTETETEISNSTSIVA